MEEVSKNGGKQKGKCAKPTKNKGDLHLLFIREEERGGADKGKGFRGKYHGKGEEERKNCEKVKNSS